MALAPVLVCAAAVAALLAAERRDSRVGVAASKPVAVASYLGLAYASGAAGSLPGRLGLLALALCALGDLLLIPRGDGWPFRAGVASFGLGHLAFAASFLARGVGPLASALAALAAGAAAAGVARWLAPRLPAGMRGLLWGYLAVIACMLALAAGAAARGAPPALALGALCFAISDLSVARDRFEAERFANRAWGLPLYFAGQLLLASAL
jgi:uncharacterized membrane protein YhhN